ncbi:PREDICTED: migration and invasion-inhibitory protein isoform X6 [Condylura cristata]|uniref:migration and invasion-inhibitory protein isoform X6 n=1 Tax=Condylura cristata TaxID=143302 RepID=UPI0006436EF6|nr:PREDICTED: migration and invasion-inhibitory protein isoform X6 [Condylura cristata]
MGETEDLVQLRQLNLELLRQLWAGQEAMRRAVARAASESSLDASSGGNSEMLSSRETSLTSVGASCPEETPPGDPWGVSWPCGASSGENSLPPGTCQHWTSLGRPRACSAPSVTTWDSSESPLSTEQNREGPPEAQAPRSLLDQRSNLPQPRVTFCKESPVPERNWRLRPYLGYDWIAGSLDSSSPVTSKPEAFFSELWHFRDANREECVCNDQGSPFLGLRERGDVPEDHESLPAGLGHLPSKIREKLSPEEPGPLVLYPLRGPAPETVSHWPFLLGPANSSSVPHGHLVGTRGSPAPCTPAEALRTGHMEDSAAVAATLAPVGVDQPA